MLKYISKFACSVVLSSSISSSANAQERHYSDMVEFSQTTLFNLTKITGRIKSVPELEIKEESVKTSWEKVFGEHLKTAKNPGVTVSVEMAGFDVPSLAVDQIFEYLDAKDCLNARQVSKQWKVAADESLSSVVLECSIQKLMKETPKSLPSFGGLHIFDKDDKRTLKDGGRILTQEAEEKKKKSFLTFIKQCKMPSLKVLSLHACFVDDSVLQKISTTFQSLEILKVDSHSYTDTGLNALETLSNLFYIDFSNTALERRDSRQFFPAITEKGLSSFVQKIQNIRFLGLGRCKKIEDLSALALGKVVGLNLDFLTLKSSQFISELPHLSYVSFILNPSVLETAKNLHASNDSFVGVY